MMLVNAQANTEMHVILSWTAIYLILFIIIHFIQTMLLWGAKHARNARNMPETGKRLLDPRVIRMKVPFFILLFAITGVLEAYFKYVEGFSSEMLFTFGAMSIFFIYLVMLVTIRTDQFRTFFMILMGGLLAVFFAHWITSLILIEYYELEVMI